MATFALIHGGGDVGWYWHLVEAALRERGHEVVAPDLPCDDDSATSATTRTRWSLRSVIAAILSSLASRTAGSLLRWWLIDSTRRRWSSCTVVSMRLGVTPDEIAVRHCVALTRPNELADMLVGHAVAERDSEQ